MTLSYAPPPWLSNLSNSASRTSHSPMTPTIKKEPGTEESPYVLAHVDPMANGTKRKARSESPSGSERASPSKKKKHERRNKVKASQVWQYLMSVSSGTLDDPPVSLVKTKYMRTIVALPRQRNLPPVWTIRLSSEKPSGKVLQLVVAWLVGDNPGDNPNTQLCDSKSSNCAAKWMTVGPAMATFEDGKNEIYKPAAFSRCVFCPELGDSRSPLGKRKCCNGTYRDSDDPSMPEVWSPPISRVPATAPACSPALPSTPIKKKPRTDESPIAQPITKTNGSKREKGDDNPSEAGPRKKQKMQPKEADEEDFEELHTRLKVTETWQYVSGFTSFELTVPKVGERFVNVLETDGARKRNLPIAWKRRLASEKLSRKIIRLLLSFLTGDEVPNSFLCSLPGANCREKWITVSPAIDSMQQGKLTIYKYGAFPRCILFDDPSGVRKCCNAVYRGMNSPPNPDVWSPPVSAPASAPARVLSPMPSAPPSTTINTAERAFPANPFTDTLSHQIIQGTPAQQEPEIVTGHSKHRNEPTGLFMPSNASQAPPSHAHSASGPQQCEEEVLPIGPDGATLQTLDLPNMSATVPLPSNVQNLGVIVHEGTVEVILQDVPAFTKSRGGRWAVAVGKECRVRNLDTESKAVLFVVGIPVRVNNE